MIIDKPMIKKSYTYKLTILDTETGEKKEFLPIHIKEFQLNIYPHKNLLDDEVWSLINDISIVNRHERVARDKANVQRVDAQTKRVVITNNKEESLLYKDIYNNLK